MMDARYKKSSSALKSSLSEKHYNLARFADYFVICGLDLENGLEAECYTGMKKKILRNNENFSIFFSSF